MGFIGDLIGDLTGANDQAEAAGKASDLQYQASMKGVEEQRRQFDKIMELMSPYVTAGTGAMGAQQNLLGLNGAAGQQSAIDALQNSPQMQSMLKQGENALLQNASATGGLRGGNSQAALAQFRPQLLNQMIQQQFSNLGGLSQMGQASAAGQASAGQNAANSISNLLQQGAAAQAGGAIAQGNASASNMGNLFKLGTSLLGGFLF